jgi:hypothetical protein
MQTQNHDLNLNQIKKIVDEQKNLNFMGILKVDDIEIK